MRPGRLLAAGLGLALLAAAGCKGGYDRDDHRTPTDLGQQYLVLSSAGASLPADGVSQVRLVAAISPDALTREVIFTTTAGKLVGGTGTTDTERTVAADSSGRATIELRSASTLGTATVTARVKDLAQVSQSLQIAFTAPSQDALLHFVSAPRSAPADGATASTFAVEVSPQIDKAANKVHFETTAGSFARGAQLLEIDVPITSDNRATAILYSASEVLEARVRASVAGAAQDARILFERAQPNLLLLSLTKTTVTVQPDDTLQVTATLLRSLGAVTPGTEVTFTATRDDGRTPVGLLTSPVVITGADGKAVTTFTPGGDPYTGLAMITAETANGLKESISFRIVPVPTS